MASAGSTARFPLERRPFHKLKVKNDIFEIDTRYTKAKYIGGGAYGTVIAAWDEKNGRKVAIKKIKDTFRELLDAKRILRELRLLQHLGGHENLIWVLDIMVSPQESNFRDVYIVTDLMETDLSRIIESSQTLSDSHIKYFVYQILRAMKYVHSANVLHRDLKPQNILVNANCELVVCDFGLARPKGSEVEGEAATELTQYVVTRWYRAPELLTGADSYDEAIDMWSIGCILAEILGRRPLFPGRNYLHQLQVIIDILGTPDDSDLWFIRRQSALKAVRGMGSRTPMSFHKLFPHANPQAIDLLQRMLAFDPAKRISVEEALAHPYLADYHYPDDEPTCQNKAVFDFEEKPHLSKQELQSLMLAEAGHFNGTRTRPVSTRLVGAGAATGGVEPTPQPAVAAAPKEPAAGVPHSKSVAPAMAAAAAALAGDDAPVPPPGVSKAPPGAGAVKAAAPASAPAAAADSGIASQLRSLLSAEFKSFKADLKGDMAAANSGIETRLAAMEARISKLEGGK